MKIEKITSFGTVSLKKVNSWHSLFFFRDDGIVIGITVWQWIGEVLFNLIAITVVARQGGNRYADHFFSLFTIWFGNIILLPYFMACAEFRRDFAAFGVKALWLALTKESYN